MSVSVSSNEQRRKREAMDTLVVDVVRGNDENVSTCLRIALERGWGSVLIDSLKEAKKRKDAEIDKICSRHYSDFLTSVREMLDMRQGSAVHLTGLIREIHDDVSETGKDLLNILNDLNRLGTEREKVQNVLESILECKILTSLINKARQCIDNEDYYLAINIINNIENSEKTKVLNIRPMTVFLQQWLPVVTSELLHAVRYDCDTMISNNRHEYVVLIGSTLLQKFAMSSLHKPSFKDVNTTSSAGVTLKDKLCSVNPSTSLSVVLKYGKLLNLEKWADYCEFDASIPQSFIDEPSTEGFAFIENFALTLGPIHKVLYSYSVLGKIDQFYEHYRVNRDSVLPVMFEEVEMMAANQGLASILPNVTARLIGFFGMECLIRHCLEVCEGVFSWMEVHTLWDKACGYLHAFVGRHCDSVRTPDQMLQIKEELLLLAETVTDDMFDLSSHGVFETMRYLWVAFESIQLHFIMDVCNDAFLMSAFQPYFVSEEDIFIKKIKAFNLENLRLDEGNTDNNSTHHSSMSTAAARKSQVLKDTSALDELEENLDIGMSFKRSGENNLLNHSSSNISSPSQKGSKNTNSVNSIFHGELTELKFMPRSFAFSEAVPLVIRNIHVVITRYFIYAAKNPFLGSRGESVCNAIKEAYESVGNILHRELVVNGDETPLSKACQISIDALAFAKSSPLISDVLESMLNHFNWTESISTHLPSAFQVINQNMMKISLQAQDMIIELLSKKVDGLLESLVFINFMPVMSASSINSHEAVDGIIDFLQITLMCLTHLPQSAREAAHFTCCSKVATGLLDYVLSSKVPALNLICIAAFGADIKKLESFADSCGILDLKQCFSEFRDVIRAVLHPDLTQLVESVALRVSLFPRLDPSKLIIILDKIVPLPLSVNAPSLTRLDKQTLKGLVKKLKQQIKQ